MTVFVALSAGAATTRADINYQFVTVGNPGNTPDTAVMVQDGTTGYGAVNYTYDIGKYDVTLNQYATFLNAVATSDPFGLYNPEMATIPNIAGISRNGLEGGYTYSVIGDGQRPVTYVNWFAAARFANWLENGQPFGLGEVAASTEKGAYNLNGATAGIFFRNPDATYWIPSENEWYKAAFYDPTLNAGSGGYWTYATRSNSLPGNVVGNLPNQANFPLQIGTTQYIMSVTQSTYYDFGTNYLSPVGAFTDSASYYGTFDQAGDVYQWNDGVINSQGRGLRGGAWNNTYDGMESTYRANGAPYDTGNNIGFRIATVPEPSLPALTSVGLAVLATMRLRRRSTSLAV